MVAGRRQGGVSGERAFEKGPAAGQLILWFFSIVLIVLPRASRGESIRVHLLAGQSNMSGRVDTDYAPSGLDTQIPYYYVSDGPAWNPESSGGQFVDLAPLNSGYYGPEIAFGRAMALLSGEPVALVKISRGDTSLAVDWNSRADEGADMWNLWVAETTKALTELERQGFRIELESILWLQGESDAIDEATANRYEFHLSNLVADMMAHLGAAYDVSNTQFVTVSPGPIDPNMYPHAEIVRLAQQRVMESLSNGHLVSTTDLTLRDMVHFDPASNHTLGLRLADAVHTPDPAPSRWALLMGAAVGFLARRRPGIR